MDSQDTPNDSQIDQLSALMSLGNDETRRIVSMVPNVVLSVDYGPLSREQFEALGTQALFGVSARRNIPSLCKFYSDRPSSPSGVVYSRQSLRNDTVHLSNPEIFNDPFDCLMNFDHERALVAVLDDFASHLGLDINGCSDSWELSSAIANHLKAIRDEELPRLASLRDDMHSIGNQIDYLSLLIDANQHGGLSGESVLSMAQKRIDLQTSLIRSCRVACFTTDVSNLYMWAHYADEHRGFCVEYALPSADRPNMDSLEEKRQEYLRSNLFGVYYHMSKPDNTDLLVKLALNHLTLDDVGALYSKILCSKGSEWAFEQEYRLIVQDADAPSEMPFFPIKAVYLGLRMSDESKQEIAAMLSGKGIQVFEMRASDSRYGLDAVAYSS